MRLLGVLGSIDGKRCLRIQNDYVRAFFDKHLKGRDNGLLDGPSADYPEVTIWVRPPVSGRKAARSSDQTAATTLWESKGHA